MAAKWSFHHVAVGRRLKLIIIKSSTILLKQKSTLSKPQPKAAYGRPVTRAASPLQTSQCSGGIRCGGCRRVCGHQARAGTCHQRASWRQIDVASFLSKSGTSRCTARLNSRHIAAVGRRLQFYARLQNICCGRSQLKLQIDGHQSSSAAPKQSDLHLEGEC